MTAPRIDPLEALETAVQIVLRDVAELGGVLLRDDQERRVFASVVADEIWEQLDMMEIRADVEAAGAGKDQVREAILRGLRAPARLLH
jgi:hypothetical protein